MGTFSDKDTVIQMAGCSFDAHMLEVVGSLIVGAAVVMLRPQGNMDFAYLVDVLHNKQITYMLIVPAFLNSLCEFFNEESVSCLETMRSICCVGE